MAQGRFSDRRLWWLAFGLYAALILLWSLSMPLFSSPDENAHVIKAAAVVRGQLLGRDEHTAAGDTLTHVTVPAALVGVVPCFAHHANIPANCAPSQTPSTELVDATTLAGHYPPLYYALVGIGSLLTPGPDGLYTMRFLSGFLSAAFIASALLSARRWLSGIGPLALGAATTPMVLFLAAGVNPNGLEITAATCLWTSVLSLLARPRARDVRLTIRLGISASAMVLTRGLSPVWLAVIVIVVVVASGFRPVARALKRWDVRLCAVAVLVATLAGTAWIVLAAGLALRPNRSRVSLPILDAVAQSFERSPYRLEQMIGIFGWLDTPSPLWTWVVWVTAVGLIVVLCLATTAGRGRAALMLLVFSAILLPVAIEASQQNALGFVWQGRYTLPIAVGIPLLGGRLIDLGRDASSPPLSQKLTAVCVPLLASAQLAAFLWNLRRNTVGTSVRLGMLDLGWQPPVPPPLLLVLFGVATVATAMLLSSAAVVARLTRASFQATTDAAPSGG